jgi:hypothetical protein
MRRFWLVVMVVSGGCVGWADLGGAPPSTGDADGSVPATEDGAIEDGAPVTDGQVGLDADSGSHAPDVVVPAIPTSHAE